MKNSTSIWLAASIILLLFFSFSPSLYELFQTGNIEPGREMVYEHGWAPDFNLYLSKMYQGAHGRWLVHELYTYENHEGSLVQIFYLLLGKIGGWLGMSPTVTYHLSRLIFGACFLLVLALLCLQLFPKSQWALAAFWLAVTTSSWPIWKLDDVIHGRFWFGSFMPWWTIIDPLNRLTAMPHLLAGQALLFLVIYLVFWGQPKGQNRLGFSLILGSLGIAMGLIFPPVLLVSLALLWLTVISRVVYDYGRQRRLKIEARFLMIVIVYTMMSALILVYLSILTTQSPWKRLNDINLVDPLSFPLYEFVLANGPFFWLALFGSIFILWQIWRKKTTRQLLDFVPIVIWFSVIFSLMVLFRQIPTQNALRFTQVAHFGPTGLLSAYALSLLARYRRRLALGLLALVLLLGLGHMGQTAYWNMAFIHQRVIATQPDVPRFPQVMYPWKEFMDAIRYLEARTPEDAVILADETMASYIPAYSGRRVYCCHANTPDKEKRQVSVWAFYQGTLPTDAHTWLKTLGISFVVFGQQEKETAAMYGISDITSKYAFLVPVYKNKRVIIYSVP